MKQLSEILQTQTRLKKPYSQVILSNILKAKWVEIFDRLADNLSFSHIRNGVLYITADNPAWVQEISYYKSEFLSKLHHHLPSKYKLKDLSVYYSEPTPVVKITSPKTSLSSGSLLEKIQRRNQGKGAMGYQPCVNCGKVLVEHSVKTCVFCFNNEGGDPNYGQFDQETT